MTPFQLLTGVKMRTKQDLEILKLLEEEIVETFTENREKIGEEAKQNILKMQEENSTRGLLATDHVILNHGQVTWTTPELAPPLLTTTPHQREDVSTLDRFNVHRCPTRRVFSGTGIELVTRQATGTGLKLRPKFFGPYEVIKVKPKDRYVRKIGLHEGPNTTSTAADHMKMWGETV
ncbi:uncharacterized protein TNCV_2152941 [Trichonephila clavipes]|nr:uncharacterized protein TNCV_2152941 [Trichonephila clavipes]